MFFGEAKHSLDTKGRLTLPAKFRDHFKVGLMVVKGEENCLQVYPPQAWEQKKSEVLALGTATEAIREYRRAVFSGAEEGELDAQGRILIKDSHKEWAELDKDVMVIGDGEFLEVWDRDRWEAGRLRREQTIADRGASAIGDLDSAPQAHQE